MSGRAVGVALAAVLAVAGCAGPTPPAQERQPRPAEPAEPGPEEAEATPPAAAPANETADEPETGPAPPAEPDAPTPESVRPGDADGAAAESSGDDADVAPSAPADEQPASAAPEPGAGAADADPATSEPAERVAEPARSTPATTRVSGRVTLTGGDARADQTVVYFVPDAGTAGARPTRSAEIATRDKTLTPAVLAVPTGSDIRFPNNDPILHNLFSVSPGNRFDLGVYGPGEAPEATFDTPGVVNIYCNVHHDMHAHVLVLDTPHFTRARTDGGFALDGLPTGPGTLKAWHRQAGEWSRRITLPLASPLTVELDITRPEIPPHRDKRGQSYQRRDRDPYR